MSHDCGFFFGKNPKLIKLKNGIPSKFYDFSLLITLSDNKFHKPIN
jgi:hypothetical protein